MVTSISQIHGFSIFLSLSVCLSIPHYPTFSLFLEIKTEENLPLNHQSSLCCAFMVLSWIMISKIFSYIDLINCCLLFIKDHYCYNFCWKIPNLEDSRIKTTVI